MNKGDVVKIIVEGYQLVDGEKSEPTKVTTTGRVVDTTDGHHIEYDETIDGYEGSILNELKIYADELTVKKSGVISSNLYLRAGESCMLHYNTPFGNLDMLVECRQMQIDVSEEAITVKAMYDMYQNKQVISQNFIGISVTR